MAQTLMNLGRSLDLDRTLGCLGVRLPEVTSKVRMHIRKKTGVSEEHAFEVRLQCRCSSEADSLQLLLGGQTGLCSR